MRDTGTLPEEEKDEGDITDGAKRLLDKVKNSPQYVFTNDKEEMYYVQIYSTKELREKHGYWPEIFSARVLARAFEQVDAGYYIKVGQDEIHDAPTQNAYENDYELIYWWRDERPFGQDSISSADLLLTDSNGGVTLGSACTAGGSKMEKFVKDPLVGSDNLHGSHAMAHEVGHAIGVGADNSPEEGLQTAGNAWVDEDDNWHRTLMMSTDEGGVNVCGESIAPREGRNTIYHQEYSACATEYFEEPLKREEIVSDST